MTRKRLLPGMLAVLAAFTAACDGGSPSGPEAAGGLSRSEAGDLAAASIEQDAIVFFAGFDAPSFSVSAGEAAPAAARQTVTTTFTRSRTCPRGGQVTVEGTLVHSWDRQARDASHQFNATRTEDDCAFAGRGGGTLTIDGAPNTVVTATRSVVGGVPQGRTLTREGAFTWTRANGESGTCAVDLTATWDPATRTHTLQGTFCNQTIDLTRTWSEPQG